LLVHYSFPDDSELANGVATLQVRTVRTNFEYTADLVTQTGAVSVANPDGTAQAEMVHAYQTSTTAPFSFAVQKRSSLLPVGANVLNWPADYADLMALFVKVATSYGQLDSNKTNFILDFEYKKMRPNQLEVKQVREVANPALQTNAFTPLLINEPLRFEVAQMRAVRTYAWQFLGPDIFAIHRLKSQWNFQTRNLPLTSSNLTACFYTNVEMEFLDDSTMGRLAGAPNQWSNAWHSGFSDGWSMGSGTNRRDLTLSLSMDPFDLPTGTVPVSLSDFKISLTANYAVPHDGATVETVYLVPARTITAEYPIQSVTFSANGVTLVATVYRDKIKLPCAPSFVAFKESTITGLTTEPIVLQGYYSQTRQLRNGAHNGWDEFLFEPALEPGLSPNLLQELRAANIRFIRFYNPGEVFAGGECNESAPGY
ncbi:MAG: hypothetical protein Q7U74_01295, partial [Saprospiraceae bacterium]|nr:hypothetical protein [Saprospiraceae bacterium]